MVAPHTAEAGFTGLNSAILSTWHAVELRDLERLSGTWERLKLTFA